MKKLCALAALSLLTSCEAIIFPIEEVYVPRGTIWVPCPGCNRAMQECHTRPRTSVRSPYIILSEEGDAYRRAQEAAENPPMVQL